MSENKDSLYHVDLVATAHHFSEIVFEQFDSDVELTNKEKNDLVIKALEKVGYSNIDQEKLNKSIFYYLTNQHVFGEFESAKIKSFPEDF